MSGATRFGDSATFSWTGTAKDVQLEIRNREGEERAVKSACTSTMNQGGIGTWREPVALGWLEGGELVWRNLHNVERSRNDRFDVAGEDIKAVVQEFGRPFVLWHAHLKNDGPSSLDVTAFPSWLVDVGAVYCIDSGRTVLYGGEIDAASAVHREDHASA